ncbi:hypothetical protein GCM10027347_10590 [Larkinella harenae]
MTLNSYEQEVSQLLALLDDVLEQYNQQNLRQRAIEYYQRLNHLKLWFSRLRSDILCETCAPNAPLPCEKVRFSRHTSLPSQFTNLSDEFAHTKSGCYQFLSVLVQLNLI